MGGAGEHPPQVDRARDVRERSASFNDYVREYGLQRSEGVLLRYLSQVYKTLVQTVPAAARTEEVDDIIAHLRVAAARRRLEPARRVGGAGAVRTARPGQAAARAAPSTRRRSGAPLQRRDPRRAAQAAARARPPRLRDGRRACSRAGPSGEAWTPERLTAEMAPFWAAHAELLTTPAARRPERTRIDELGPGRFRAQQTLVDGEGDEDWSLDCIVD